MCGTSCLLCSRPGACLASASLHALSLPLVLLALTAVGASLMLTPWLRNSNANAIGPKWLGRPAKPWQHLQLVSRTPSVGTRLREIVSNRSASE